MCATLPLLFDMCATLPSLLVGAHRSSSLFVKLCAKCVFIKGGELGQLLTKVKISQIMV